MADFVMATFGRWTARTTTEAEAVTLVPDGEVPVAVPRVADPAPVHVGLGGGVGGRARLRGGRGQRRWTGR